MQAEEHLRAGRVEDALRVLQEQVREHPESAQLRAFLFQVLSVLGQWDRVLTQLKVLGDLNSQALVLSRMYEVLVQAEILRRDIFAGKTSAMIFGEPEPWMAQLLHGNSLAAKGDFAGAQKCLQEALEASPGLPGTINGAPCQWLADADLRFGACLEAVIDGKYFWVPFFRIKQLRLLAPKHIRDLVWLPVSFIWTNDGEAAGFIFTRYPGTDTSGDGELRLARKTEWDEKAPGLSFGRGQRTLVTDSEEYPILDLRSIDLTPNPSPVPT